MQSIPTSQLLENQWLPLDPEENMRYLRIEADNPALINEPMPFQDRLPFMDQIYESMSADDSLNI